jgi:hypothetical protein
MKIECWTRWKFCQSSHFFSKSFKVADSFIQIKQISDVWKIIDANNAVLHCFSVLFSKFFVDFYFRDLIIANSLLENIHVWFSYKFSNRESPHNIHPTSGLLLSSTSLSWWFISGSADHFFPFFFLFFWSRLVNWFNTSFRHHFLARVGRWESTPQTVFIY